jgi:hypothetical protein
VSHADNNTKINLITMNVLSWSRSASKRLGRRAVKEEARRWPSGTIDEYYNSFEFLG